MKRADKEERRRVTHGRSRSFSFSQSCRGTQLDNGVEIIHETDSTSNYSLPAYADIMVAYSTYDGG